MAPLGFTVNSTGHTARASSIAQGVLGRATALTPYRPLQSPPSAMSCRLPPPCPAPPSPAPSSTCPPPPATLYP